MRLPEIAGTQKILEEAKPYSSFCFYVVPFVNTNLSICKINFIINNIKASKLESTRGEVTNHLDSGL